MFPEKFIKIEGVKIRDGNTAEFSLSYPNGLKKYFSSDCLYINYSQRIDSIDHSILYVPAVSTLITLAWAVGANIYVKKLDETFLDCLIKIKPIMAKWHPSFSFSGNIKTESVVSNKFYNKEYGLLFSGGIDSTVSYIRNERKKPNLISIWGLDVTEEKKELWKKIEARLKVFAEQENVKIHFIKSNARQLINESLLSVEFGRSWWVRVSHGITTIGLCSPLTTKGIGTVLIASTRGPQLPGEIRYPLGSSPLIDNKISWADVKVVHDGFDLNRQEKIKLVLKDYIQNGNYPFLRVCTSPTNELNCSRCNKCLPSMAGLALEGIDPNKCGFTVNENTWIALRQRFIEKNYQAFENEQISPEFMYRTDDWKEIQKEIPVHLTNNLYSSKEFFEWLRSFDLTNYGLENEKKLETARLFEVLRFRILGCILLAYYALPKLQQTAIKRLLEPNLGFLQKPALPRTSKE